MSKIVVYSTPSCMACRSTQTSFEKAGVAITKVDLTKDMEAYERLSGMGFAAAPIVEVIKDDVVVDIWSGFRIDKISQFSN